jgi:hypothetical protein
MTRRAADAAFLKPKFLYAEKRIPGFSFYVAHRRIFDPELQFDCSFDEQHIILA